MKMGNTKAQLNAKVRNWQILRLRGFYTLAVSLDNEILKAEVDKELAKLGAETEADRAKRRLLEEFK